MNQVRFVGARLVEARLARGISGAALAELLDISTSAISQYENERIAPRPEVLEQLTRQLNVPTAFFFRNVLSEEPDRPMFWRSLGLASKAGHVQARQRFRWLREIVRYVNTHLEFPTIDLPELNIGDPLGASLEQIESAADEVRLRWGLGDGPIEDAILLLENHGVVVTRTNFGDRGLDAFSYWSAADGLPYVVIGDDKGSAVRERYDALHELAHLLMHSKLDVKALSAKRGHRLLEDQAFRFASALALPAKPFLADLWAPTLDAFRSLKPRWKVSIGVMIHRCQELNVTTPEQTQRLWINYSRRGWRKDEPLDDMPVEQPRLLKRSFDLLVSSGTKTRAQIVTDLALPGIVIESLVGLPVGYFKDDFGTTAAFVPKLRRDDRPATIASIVDFSQARKDQGRDP